MSRHEIDEAVTQLVEREKPESRTYEIEGPPEQLRELEKLLGWIDHLCDVGHSASATIGVDGDGSGAIRVQVKRGGKLVRPDMPTEEDDNYEPYVAKGLELRIGIGG